ncbi:MAG: universal stress protein [Deltaproteobacteria bacterium]|nr:universal stress protein [Deltaproteobacteria bacterium]
MPQIKNILVPVELGENAVPVVTWASLIARATESRIALLHVNEALEPIKTRLAFQGEGTPGTAAAVETWRSASSQAARLELARLAERYCAGVPCDTVLLEGRAHGTILGYLEHTPYDLEESRRHPPRPAQPFWDHAHRVAQEKLRLLQHQFLEAHVQVQVLMRDGSAAEEILLVAEQTSADLIIMTTHGRTGLRRLLIGRVTERVVHRASCPVFVVPSRV